MYTNIYCYFNIVHKYNLFHINYIIWRLQLNLFAYKCFFPQTLQWELVVPKLSSISLLSIKFLKSSLVNSFCISSKGKFEVVNIIFGQFPLMSCTVTYQLHYDKKCFFFNWTNCKPIYHFFDFYFTSIQALNIFYLFLLLFSILSWLCGCWGLP